MKFSREWSMPSADTFECPAIASFVKRYISESRVSVDPFARNNTWSTYSNDINPNTRATHHYDAEEFLNILKSRNVEADLLILDPPYSPRQISECYKDAGLPVTSVQTQNGALYRRVIDAAMPLLSQNAIVLHFGWNSSGVGRKRGFAICEIMMVCHGGAHNDTICMAEYRVQGTLL